MTVLLEYRLNGDFMQSAVCFDILQGVKFMYDCVTGVQIEDCYGCIMADEMVSIEKSFSLLME